MQLPAALVQSLRGLPGFDEEAFVQVHESAETVTSVRFNPGKGLKNSCAIYNETAGKIPWSSEGYYLKQRPSFTLDPMFHAGAYYVQEASSMFLEEAVRQTCNLSEPLRVLDLCAAPGGKSTLLQSVIPDNSLLVSNEVIKPRVNILEENLSKWGGANVVVTNNDPRDFQRLPSFFDLVVVDAPCSGSGLFRKDPLAVSEWSPGNVDLCSQRQERILADVLPCLKPGGILIYSTCSYSEKEDELIASWLISELPVTGIRLLAGNDWGLVETGSTDGKAWGYRFYPDKVKGEGFFLAAFRKTGEAAEGKHILKKSKFVLPSASELETCSHFLDGQAQLSIFKWQDDLFAVPASLQDDMALLQALLYVKKSGVKLGKVIRNQLLPDHELAMSNLLPEHVPCVSVQLEEALHYLRREELVTGTAVKGWALIRYHDANLGWAKILPGRINNYYPKGWRILNK